MIILLTLAAHPCSKTPDPEPCRVPGRLRTRLKAPAGFLAAGRPAGDPRVVPSGRLKAALRGIGRSLMFAGIEAAARR